MKKLFKILILSSIILTISGCLKSENLDNAMIYTTSYPITFLVNEIYGFNSTIDSIYPNGINIEEYTLSNKKIKTYSKGDLFVYNGIILKERQTAADLANKNKKLKIIDVSQSLQPIYSSEELWLNPSNYLMIAQNIKNGLKEFIKSTVIKEQIDENYNKIKVTISEFENDIKTIIENSENKTIIVSKDFFKFLENYGFEVISLEENSNLSNDTINIAKNLIKEKKIKYIFITDDEKENTSNTINDVLKLGGEAKVFHTLTNLTSEQINSNENYISLMRENIELLKETLYA